MDKKLIIFLIISSIFIIGASCSDSYNRESSEQPIQPNQEAVGSGCGVAGYENSDTEIKYVQIAGAF